MVYGRSGGTRGVYSTQNLYVYTVRTVRARPFGGRSLINKQYIKYYTITTIHSYRENVDGLSLFLFIYLLSVREFDAFFKVDRKKLTRPKNGILLLITMHKSLGRPSILNLRVGVQRFAPLR
jgi:hypothetical protein